MQLTPLTVLLDLGGDGWRMSIYVGLTICAFFLLSQYLKRIGIALSLLWLQVVAFSLIMVSAPGSHFGQYQVAFSATAGDTLATALLLPLTILSIPERYLSRAMLIIPAFAIIENLMIWVSGSGLMLAPSFDTSLIAMALPFSPWWLKIASLGTIISRHGSTAILIVLAQIFALGLKNKRLRWWLLGSVPILIAAAWRQSGHLFDGAERLRAYDRFMTMWWNQEWLKVIPAAEAHSVWFDRLFGTGPGSFVWLSLCFDKFQEPMFIQMHSDWLQITFELGIIGLALVIAVFVKTTKAAWNNPSSLCGIFGVAAFMLTYHPMRFFPTMICMALILRKNLS